MNDNLSYNVLKTLSDEEKREVLVQLKEKFASYKEMADKIGGSPLVLSNMYLRVVEGKKFGRNKKIRPEAVVEEVIKPKRKYTTRKSKQAESLAQLPVAESEGKKVLSFNIGLNLLSSGEDAVERINGIAGALLKDRKYKVQLMVEEV
jgi:hypothetical protein